jgi:hypothetical protein
MKILIVFHLSFSIIICKKLMILHFLNHFVIFVLNSKNEEIIFNELSLSTPFDNLRMYPICTYWNVPWNPYCNTCIHVPLFIVIETKSLTQVKDTKMFYITHGCFKNGIIFLLVMTIGKMNV